jgi:hypothetical protein
MPTSKIGNYFKNRQCRIAENACRHQKSATILKIGNAELPKKER